MRLGNPALGLACLFRRLLRYRPLCPISATTFRHRSDMPFQLERLLRQIVASLIAVALVIVAFGSSLPASHAAGMDSSCSSAPGAISDKITKTGPDHGFGMAQVKVLTDPPDVGAPDENDRASTKACCSSYCAPTLSLAGSRIDLHQPHHAKDWTITVQSLRPSQLNGLKRPPRTISAT